MADAEDLIYLPPLRKLAHGVHGAGELELDYELLSEPSPLSIFAADLSRIGWWLRADDASQSSWADVTGNLTITATGTQQPTISSGINGKTTVLFDGTDDYMAGSAASPLALGSRPFFIVIARYAADPGTGNRLLFSLADSDGLGFGLMTHQIATVTSVRRLRLSQVKPGPASYSWVGPVFDTNAHVFEYGWPNSLTGHYVVDGTAYNTLQSGSADSGGLLGAAEFVELGNNSVLSVSGNVHVRDLFCLRDQPSASELTALRAWAQYRIDGVLP